MNRKYIASLAVLLGTAAIVILLLGTRSPAKPLPEEVRPTTATAKLVVHEWGTFTSFSGSDGKLLKFVHKSNDLPNFVHQVYMGKGGDGYDPYNPVSLETPVLYFYTEQEARVSVQVDFPKGVMSEWYPQAQGLTHRESRRVKRLVWKDVQLLPRAPVALQRVDDEDEQAPGNRARVQLRVGKTDSHYYAARETDAAPLQVGKEQEKFLFYRGVADFAPPLSVQALGGGEFRVKNNGKEKATGLVLLHSSGDAICFEPLGALDAGAETRVVISCKNVPCPENLEEAANLMVRSLVAAGLYEKEARAMVKTWKADWFADAGTRLLYVAPARMADDILPLKVEPKPAAVVRVLVGRHDILTPGQERDLDSAVRDLQKWQAEHRALTEKCNAAYGALYKQFGRFTDSAQNAAERRLKK